MVMQNNIGNAIWRTERINRFDDPGTNLWMLLEQNPFFGRQWPCFFKNRVWYTDLADIMQVSCYMDHLDIHRCKTVLAGNKFTNPCHLFRVVKG